MKVKRLSMGKILSSGSTHTYHNFIDSYLRDLRETLSNLSLDDIAEVTHVLFTAWSEEKMVFICGNGGSSATASHMANDLNKFTIVPNMGRFKALALTDNVPLMTAWGNDAEYATIFAEQMLNFIKAGDILIVISCSGNSSNILHTVRVARERGAVIIGFTGHQGGQLVNLVDYCVRVPNELIGPQEDVHLILNHVIVSTLRQLIVDEARKKEASA
jgi:D-sedoheptulose 7-phosphate isomerase